MVLVRARMCACAIAYVRSSSCRRSFAGSFHLPSIADPTVYNLITTVQTLKARLRALERDAWQQSRTVTGFESDEESALSGIQRVGTRVRENQADFSKFLLTPLHPIVPSQDRECK